MEARRFGSRFVIRIDKGEEIVESLKKFCQDNGIRLAVITGLGATNLAKVGLFRTATKEYASTELKGDYEIAPLYGNVTTKDGEIYLHLHANLAGADHKAVGGHLNSAVVSATFEGVIDVIEGNVGRKFNETIGLNLLDFGRK